jgi:hypothetical protein
MQGIEPQFLGYPARNQVTVLITLKWLTTSCSVKFISKPLFFVVCVGYYSVFLGRWSFRMLC